MSLFISDYPKSLPPYFFASKSVLNLPAHPNRIQYHLGVNGLKNFII